MPHLPSLCSAPTWRLRTAQANPTHSKERIHTAIKLETLSFRGKGTFVGKCKDKIPLSRSLTFLAFSEDFSAPADGARNLGQGLFWRSLSESRDSYLTHSINTTQNG